LPPNEPGWYRLKWDLVLENVGWFSQRGWSAPEQEVYLYRSVIPQSDLRAQTFARFFGVNELALDSGNTLSPSAGRLMELEADRLAREETIAALSARLGNEGQLVTQQQGLDDLTEQLKDSEADRAARLEVIKGLSAHVKLLETECAKRLELINDLTAHIAELEAECAKRLQIINRRSGPVGLVRRAWRAIRRPFTT
jgi:uncharacterized coiled-coil protein SlyX